MKKFTVSRKSSTLKTKLIAMLVIGCSIASQFAAIPAYAGTNSDTNIALGKTATASVSFDAETPSKAVNGTYSNRWDKWCTSYSDSEKWLKLDLGSNYDINRWVVYHAGVFENHPEYNTRDFRLQKSDDNITWTDVDTVTQNTDPYTERRVPTFNTRYVRLYIDCGQRDNNDVARIYEFQLFYDKEVNIALNKAVTSSKELSWEAATSAVNGTYNNSRDKWCTGWANGEEKWITVDLGRVYTIDRWRVVHAGVLETTQYNTKNFRLQRSFDGVNWRNVDVVTNNTSTITDEIIPTSSGRYFRLWIDQSTQYDDSCARIYEFQLFNTYYTSQPDNLAYNKETEASRYCSYTTPYEATDGSIYDDLFGDIFSSKWTTPYGEGDNSWLLVDLGSTCTINKWVVISAGIEDEIEYINKTFKLQASNDKINWVDIDRVENNFQDVCSRNVDAFSARYVRLFIEKSCIDNSARVYEFELYNQSR